MSETVLVVGAGIMGAGIAQVAAQAGHPVLMFDLRPGAAEQAVEQLGRTWQTLVDKGKLGAAEARAARERVRHVDHLAKGADAALVVEAIVEELGAKQALMAQLESLVGDDCVLASNTSSISITAIAKGLRRPGRVVGMHFFNPVPLMRLVEVVCGLQTDPAVADRVQAWASAWGKHPVRARSTPGFIVNRIARPYYAEALMLLQEQVARPEVIDACLRAVGFRMGPCELMDLIGHDTNFAVTRSVFEANFGDRRYTPSLVQRELVDGGLLGRKSGQGFYRYPEGAPALAEAPACPAPALPRVTLHGHGPSADWLRQGLAGWSGAPALAEHPESDWTGLDLGQGRLVVSDGRTASALRRAWGCPVAVVDRLPGAFVRGVPLAWAVAPDEDLAWTDAVPGLLQAMGLQPQRVGDAPGLVVARTLAMLINEAADAVQQGVCTPEAADAAMRLGVNYPAGPFEWLAGWDVAAVVALLQALDDCYRGERYRVSPWLRQRT